ncbi:MAG: Gx transporter family protein [Oscillospiraceae bacterium]|nr:Gx transporter family protein [Oscillospiraceae bacterium]
MSAKKLALCGLFICFAAALSALETWLPPIVPIPAVRVGLGNIVTLFMLYLKGSWRFADALAVSVLRCAVAALITGSLMNMIFGITGGVLALSAMTVVKRLLPKRNVIGLIPFVGISGALLHIFGQLVTAAVFYGTVTVFAYTPILLASAVIGGAFTGLCTKLLLKKLDPKILSEVENV